MTPIPFFCSLFCSASLSLGTVVVVVSFSIVKIIIEVFFSHIFSITKTPTVSPNLFHFTILFISLAPFPCLIRFLYCFSFFTFMSPLICLVQHTFTWNVWFETIFAFAMQFDVCFVCLVYFSFPPVFPFLFWSAIGICILYTNFVVSNVQHDVFNPFR